MSAGKLSYFMIFFLLFFGGGGGGGGIDKRVKRCLLGLIWAIFFKGCGFVYLHETTKCVLINSFYFHK